MNPGRSQPTEDPASIITVDFSGVWCPSCKAGVREHCLTKSGKFATEAHSARQYLYYTTFPETAPLHWRQKYPNVEGVAAPAPGTGSTVTTPLWRLKPPGMDLVELVVAASGSARVRLRCLICDKYLDETVVLLADAVRVWTEHVNTKERDLT